MVLGETPVTGGVLKLGSHSYFYIRSGPETLELDMQKHTATSAKPALKSETIRVSQLS